MADCNFAYPKPDDFQAAAKNVIAKITGSSAVDNACAVHCGWVVLGYGANLLLPCEEAGSDLSIQPAAAPAGGLKQCSTPQDVADCLELATSVQPSGGQPAGVGAGFDWQSLITALLPIILQWLSQK